jgi:glycosyltransferase involved in cell wall biosynthesis
MKILIASDTYFPNVDGASYFTYRLATQLAKRGNEVFVVAPGRGLKSEVKKEGDITVLRARSVPVLLYPKFRFSPPAITQRAITDFIKETKPDIIHIQNHIMIGRAVLKAARELHIPIMGTNHFMPENLVHYVPIPQVEQALKDLGWKVFRGVFKHMELVTTPTQTAANLLKQIGWKKEVIPLSCGIDLKRFNPNNDSSYIKAKFNLPDRPILLFVGRLEKEKRIEVILRALPLILKKTQVQLVLIGPGSLKDTLKKLSEELGVADHVTFPGFITDEDLPNFYKAASVFAIAGIAELQSIATMEAMASGLPVLACNAMALPELAHDGENGFLFADGDYKTLADKAIKLLSDNDLRKRMSQKSLEIIAKHDINKVMGEFENLYRRAIRQYAQRGHGPVVAAATRKIRKIFMIPALAGFAVIIFFLAAELRINFSGNASASVVIKKTPKEVVTETYQKTNIRFQKMKGQVQDKVQYFEQKLQN